MDEFVEIITEPEIPIDAPEEDSEGGELIADSPEERGHGRHRRRNFLHESFIGFDPTEQFPEKGRSTNLLDRLKRDEDDFDDEDEVEELLVFANFNNHLSMKELKDQEAKIKLIGLDGTTPMAEVNGCIFSGSYDYSLGTSVFFAKNDRAPAPHALYEEPCQQMFTCVHKTNKVISFKRIYVEKNPDEVKDILTKCLDSESESTQEPNELEHVQTLKSDITYEGAINTFPYKEKSL